MIPVLDFATETRRAERWFLGLAILLSSFLVLAQSADRLELAPAYDDDRVQDEIYGGAQWRLPPKYDAEWRAAEYEPKSRISFGYDSAHEEMRAREFDNSPAAGSNIGGVRPDTQFRIKW